MKYFFLVFFFLNFTARAQKEVIQTFDAENLNTVVFNSDEIYKITVKTGPGKQILVRSRSEGEYFNNISLDTEVRKNVLFLKSRYREILQSGFDKLSAHKVYAMEVLLEIPEGMKVEIRSNVASVFMEGTYEEVLIQLKSGSAYLENFLGDAVINTYNGNIEVAAANAKVEAESRHGSVIVPDSGYGTYSIKLLSINGNIKVVRETK